MHIALFSPAWDTAPHPNGIVTYVRGMRDELMRQGHRVSVFTGPAQPPAAGIYPVLPSTPSAVASWVRRRLLPQHPEVLRWGETVARSVRSVHRAEPIDVFEMEESFGWFGSVASLLPLPVVVKLHGPAFMTLLEEEQLKPLALAKIEAEGSALRKCSVITAPSRCTLDATIRRYGLEPRLARRVANPLSLPASAAVWSLAECERRTLLFVGRFDKLKGGDIVLRAFALLLRRNPDLRLLFVGPDPGLGDGQGRTIHFAEMAAELFPGEAAERVVFKGRLEPAEIYELRARAFATIVASRFENQSYTLLEAMLQGCPIVSTDVGGQAEAVRHGERGLLCKPESPEDLAAKTQQLLDDPEHAATLGAAARRFAVSEYSPQAAVSQTLEVYREAVALSEQPRSTASLHG
jgi:glycosyltransferase involved in cell wall biosynthesis